jgi:hypothetical protein
MSHPAEVSGSAAGVAALSAQALRSVEVGSRLASTSGYAAPRTVGQPGEGRTFSIEIVFASIGTREEITMIETGSVRDAPDGNGGAEDGIVDG